MRTLRWAPVALLCLAGCATGELPPGPPVAMSDAGGATVAADIVQLVQMRLQPGSGPVSVTGPDPYVGRYLDTMLRAGGYHLTDRAQHLVSYRLAPFGSELLVRVHIDGIDAARLYRASPTGGLEPASPFSVTEGA
jgi:hypothetical protein